MKGPKGFLADEDFRNAILRGLVRRMRTLDIVRAQDVGLAGKPDPAVLEWAAQHERIVLTHDVSTMPAHAYARLRAGLRVPGVCVVPQSLPVGQAIEDLLLAMTCGVDEDWENQVRYLPF